MHAGLWKLWKRLFKMKILKGYQPHNVLPEKEFSELFQDSKEEELVSDEPVTGSKQFAAGGIVRPKRVITLKESDYAQLQSLVLKYGSGTGHGTSLSIDARVAVADATYDWSKDEDTSRKAD